MSRLRSGNRIGEFLKEGTKSLSGLEEAVLRNIEACKDLQRITRTSLGPNGMSWVNSVHFGMGTHEECSIS